MSLGRYFGPIFTIILLVDCLFFAFLEWWLPQEDIERAEAKWDPDEFLNVCLSAYLLSNWSLIRCHPTIGRSRVRQSSTSNPGGKCAKWRSSKGKDGPRT